MCGIAGIMTPNGAPPDSDALGRLMQALVHRGPDGQGMHVAGGTGLVHTRLAIIDLETGDQPFLAGDGPAAETALVANGEIYNYIELRDMVIETPPTTKSDCETPLHLYLAHGMEFADYLRGMYAVAIYDSNRDRLVLTRDPFGIKPLYYAETDKGFVFSSEPQAMIKAGLVTAEANPQAVNQLLQLQFTTGTETAFKGVFRLLPGETVAVEGGRIIERRRRPALPDGPPRPAANALLQLDEVLNDTIDVHQRSDVPYGMFLSGGIDSSVVLAMMARLNERPVRAFTIGFPGTKARDERDHARAVAEAVGAEHVEVDFTEDDFWSLLPAVVAATDDPAADYAILPTYKLARTVHEHGLKVVLSGEGGDEMFGGYGRYRRAMRPRLFGGRPMRQRGMLDGLGVLRDEGADWRAGIAAVEKVEATAGRTALQVNQAVDFADWLPNDLLIKLDRCLMAHGVEGRTPFLDPKMANFAYLLPDRQKVRRRHGKWLLRRWLQTGLPAADPFSRKRGFTVPVGEWMARRGKELAPLIAADPGISEACHPQAAGDLFKRLGSGHDNRRTKAAWVLLYYALWHRHHIRGLPAAGDAIENLAAGG